MTGDPSDSVVTAWVRLVRASNYVLSAVENDLKAAGFPSLAWYDVLLELDRSGDNHLRPFELEARLLLEQYNLSRLMDRLVSAGYVEKLPYAGDGRGHVLAITKRGKALLKKMWPVYRAAIDRHLGDRLCAKQTSDLSSLLNRLVRDQAKI